MVGAGDDDERFSTLTHLPGARQQQHQRSVSTAESTLERLDPELHQHIKKQTVLLMSCH